MTIRLSTGHRNANLGKSAVPQEQMTATTISFGDATGTGGRDQILDSGNGLGNFSIGDIIKVTGSTSNNFEDEILAVAAGSIEIASGTVTTEAAGDQVVLSSARGGSIADLYKYGVIRIFAGSMPANADATEGSTHLVEITQSSGAFVAGTETNGLLMGDVANGVLVQRSGEVWSGVATATGEAGWARFYDNSLTTGASTTAVRFDINIATSGAAFVMTNTSITSGGTTTVDSVAITLPAS